MKKIAFLLLSLSFCQLSAQDKNEKGSLKLDMAYYQKNDDVPFLKISAKTKIKKKFKPVAGITVNVFIGNETAKGFLGQVVTQPDGTNTLALTPAAKKSWDTLTVFKFVATVTKNEQFEDASAELEITKAHIELVTNEKDSTRTLRAKVFARKDTSWRPLANAELKFVIKRYFSDLAVIDNAVSTNDEGIATATFNTKIPGDTEGNILVAAKIEDNETYGNLQTTKVVKWGTPVLKDDSFDKRTLWATRDKTPLWLLIFPNLIIAAVWGFIFYLVYLIIKIRKVGLEP